MTGTRKRLMILVLRQYFRHVPRFLKIKFVAHRGADDVVCGLLCLKGATNNVQTALSQATNRHRRGGFFQTRKEV